MEDRSQALLKQARQVTERPARPAYEWRPDDREKMYPPVRRDSGGRALPKLTRADIEHWFG